jgi:hypothetical protein
MNTAATIGPIRNPNRSRFAEIASHLAPNYGGLHTWMQDDGVQGGG